MSDYLPVYAAGITPFTVAASAAITGGQLVEATTTGKVGPAGAASVKVVGVAAHDAANGAIVSVWPIDGAVVHETTTPAGVTVGARLAAAAAGTVDSGTAATLAAAGTDLGVALTTASAGAKTQWIGR